MKNLHFRLIASIILVIVFSQAYSQSQFDFNGNHEPMVQLKNIDLQFKKDYYPTDGEFFINDEKNPGEWLKDGSTKIYYNESNKKIKQEYLDNTAVIRKFDSYKYNSNGDLIELINMELMGFEFDTARYQTWKYNKDNFLIENIFENVIDSIKTISTYNRSTDNIIKEYKYFFTSSSQNYGFKRTYEHNEKNYLIKSTAFTYIYEESVFKPHVIDTFFLDGAGVDTLIERSENFSLDGNWKKYARFLNSWKSNNPENHTGDLIFQIVLKASKFDNNGEVTEWTPSQKDEYIYGAFESYLNTFYVYSIDKKNWDYISRIKVSNNEDGDGIGYRFDRWNDTTKIWDVEIRDTVINDFNSNDDVLTIYYPSWDRLKGEFNDDIKEIYSNPIVIGVERVDFANRFKIFPNPSSGEVRIIAGKPTVNIYSISIFNIEGKRVKNIPNFEINSIGIINISDLKKGIYSISILSDEGISNHTILKN